MKKSKISHISLSKILIIKVLQLLEGLKPSKSFTPIILSTSLRIASYLLPITYCSLISPPSVFGQNWKLYKKNDALDCRFFVTDALHNVYIITSKNEILKYNADGSFEARYVNLKMGKLVQLDATNSFKLLVYYADFQTIQLLDNELNSLGSVNLRDAGLAQVGSITMSDDGKVWAYDAGTSKLVTVVDKKAQQTQSSVVPFSGATPNSMLFRNNTLYVSIPSKGIYTFDRFGKFLKLLDIKNADYFQVVDNRLFYQQSGKLNILNLQTFKSTPMKMPEGITGNEPLRLEKSWLFVQKGKTIIIHEDK